MTLRSGIRSFRLRLMPLLLVLLSVVPYAWDIGLAPDSLARRWPDAEEATPDSPAPASTAPAAERARHLANLGVLHWHRAGYRGRGITVAILDSGFRGYRQQLGKALPDFVAARSFRADHDLEARDSQHGILCGEVVHALAPDARILFANWEPDHPASFLEAVRWARAQGANILSCSLIMPSWSDGEGGGSVHAALGRELGAGHERRDMLFFACAGNTAQRHWSGSFCSDPHGYHEWRPGLTENLLRPWGGDRVAVELYSPADGPYEVQVFEQESQRLVGKAIVHRGFDEPPVPSNSEAGGCAVVRFIPDPNQTYTIRLHLAGQGNAGARDKFHLVALGASLQRATSSGSISFPADGEAVEAVGAVDSEGRRLCYSSCGPNSRRPKPDLVAPVPFASFVRERAFAGTSAAAPQAAALAALWWSRHPDWTADHVRRAIHKSATDLGPTGHDWETGYGLVHLPEALQELIPRGKP